MQKKILAALLTLCMLLSVAPLAVSAADEHVHSWADKACTCGAKAITTADELVTLMGDSSAWGTSSAPVHYVLVPDASMNATFDMSGKNVSPIGTSTVPFYGTFDGNDCTISNINLDMTADDETTDTDKANNDYVGLFGVVEKATIQDLTVKGSVTGGNYVGGIVGLVQTEATITNCTNECTVKATGYAGGIVGALGVLATGVKATVQDCTNNGTVTANGRYAGGITSYAHGSSDKRANIQIVNCKNTNAVKAEGDTSHDVGGIVGIAYCATVSKCTNSGSVNGNTYVSGIVGRTNSSATIEYCKNTGAITGTTQVAGIVANLAGSNSDVSTCWNDGTVKATTTSTSVYANVGGIIGLYTGGGNVTYCYNSGTVQFSRTYAGGIIGQAKNGSNTVSYCYSKGKLDPQVEDYGNAEGVRSICGWPIVGIFANCYYSYVDEDGNIDTTTVDTAGDKKYKTGYNPTRLGYTERDSETAAWTNYTSANKAAHIDALTATGDWIKTTNGPELKYFHDQGHTNGATSCAACTCDHSEDFGVITFTSVSDTKHKCSNCEVELDHNFTDSECACGLVELTIESLTVDNGSLKATFVNGVGTSATLDTSEIELSENEGTYTVSGLKVRGNYLLTSGSHTIDATYIGTVTATVDGEDAGVSIPYIKGMSVEVTLSAPADKEGYDFAGWKVDGTTYTTSTFTIPASKTNTDSIVI